MVLAAADAAAMERCADAFELRVDLLGSGRSFEDLRSQYTLLRRAMSLPIIWTIRSKAQGGEKLRNSKKHSKPTQHHLLKRKPKFLGPDPEPYTPGAFEGDEKAYEQLVNLGSRLGCEFIDVENCWSTPCKARLLGGEL